MVEASEVKLLLTAGVDKSILFVVLKPCKAMSMYLLRALYK